MFRGIGSVNVDVKGRMALPAKFRQSSWLLPEATLIVTIDPEDPCLWLYPMSQWEPIEASIEALPSFHPATRRVKRLLIGHATEVMCDGQGRILLPSLLREYANIDKKSVLIGQGKKIEIWAEEAWQKARADWLEVSANDACPDVLGEIVV